MYHMRKTGYMGGKNGCPIVSKGNEMGVLFGNWEYMIHYNCEFDESKK